MEAKKGLLMVWNTDEKNGVRLRGADCKNSMGKKQFPIIIIQGMKLFVTQIEQ